MTETLTKLAYQTFQQGKSSLSLLHKTVSAQILNLMAPAAEESKGKSLSPAILQQIHQSMSEMLDIDWQDAERGIYPVDLLFETSWEDFLRTYPQLCLDMPQIWERSQQKRYQDFTPDIETDGYPDYYVQNFHHQTNGYLSDQSAELYDLQVDILFNGAADAMRRRILAPLKQALAPLLNGPDKLRILDIACGTGRTLRFLRSSFPKASLYGVDLSPAYLRRANQMLSRYPGELPQLIQANAEQLPYLDQYFHAVSSVFLFHELPPNARQQVIEECFRVLKPGGVFVICDSIQLDDRPDFSTLMENFPVMFHEPYYRHYVQDDLTERLQKAGFTEVTKEVHFMSKYLIAHKPR